MKSRSSGAIAQPAHGKGRRRVVMGIVTVSLVAGLVMIVQRREDRQPDKIKSLATTHIEPRTAAPDPAEARLRRGVSDVLGFTGGLPTQARIRELMEMGDQLTEDEVAELLRGLLSPRAQGEAVARHSTWFHELANLLQRQNPDPHDFSEVLATVARDGKRDLATRDYALQHLRRIWGKASADPELRGAIEATFAEMAVAGNPMRATALLSLHMLDPSGSAMDDTALAGSVMALLEDNRSTGDEAVRARMVAARIAGERRLDGSRGPLLKLATGESVHALVRMAAISALGRFADPSDLETLRSLAPADERVAVAIRHATSASTGQ